MATSPSKHRQVGQPANSEPFDDLLEKMLAAFLAEYPELQIVVFRPEESGPATADTAR